MLRWSADPGYTILFFILLAGLFAACENDLARVNRFISQEQASVETGTGVDILYSDSADVKIRIVGPRMIRQVSAAEPVEEFPDGLKVYFLGPDKQVESILSAKYGIRYPYKDKVIVKDSVVMENFTEKRKLETEDLVWEFRRGMVYNNKFVKISTPSDTLYGYSFSATQDFKRYEMRNLGGKMEVEAVQQELH